MTNQLHLEKSPYLKQHSKNPVNWLAWSTQALQKAQTEGKPLFISIGYATCHWCHVMESESFQDPEVASILNRAFVSIKIDREERPDLDHLYMSIAQGMGWGGGWPLNVFANSQGIPFTGGTYFPPRSMGGRPSFKTILLWLEENWVTKKEEWEVICQKVYQAFKIESNQSTLSDAESKKEAALKSADVNIKDSGLAREAENPWNHLPGKSAITKKHALLDREWGGYGQAPKFPMGQSLCSLLILSEMLGDEEVQNGVLHSLDKMARGGMHDQVGGGFHRYSTDHTWTVPHFEKMLYDQAQLLGLYVYAYAFTKKVEYARIAGRIVEYLWRDMKSADGPFYAAEDADSEGSEGAFYLWEAQDLADLGLTHWCRVPAQPHYEGLYIPEGSWGLPGKDWLSILHKLRKACSAREKRSRPLRDEKLMQDWNGLLLSALIAQCRFVPDSLRDGDSLLKEQVLAQAKKSAHFLWESGFSGPSKLMSKYYLEGNSRHDAVLEDYAFMARAYLDLYCYTFEKVWLGRCLHLVERMLVVFWNPTLGYFNQAHAKSDIPLHVSPDFHDGAIPPGQAVAMGVLGQLYSMGWASGRDYLNRFLAVQGEVFLRNEAYCLCLLQELGWASKKTCIAVFSGPRGSEFVQRWRSELLATPFLHLGLICADDQVLLSQWRNPKDENPFPVSLTENDSREKSLINPENSTQKVGIHFCRDQTCGPILNKDDEIFSAWHKIRF